METIIALAMKFYSWNVNGIRAVVRKGTFQKFIAEHQPDILCLQETKAEKGQAEIDLPDYHEYWNSAEKKGYSGTAIFSKQKPIEVTNGFPDEFARKFTFADELKRDSWNEGRVITAEFEKFYAVTVYTPNAKDDLSRVKLRHEHWDPAFLAYVRAAGQEKARDLLRRPQCRAHGTGPRQSQAQQGQEGIHRRGARGLPEFRGCRLRRHVPHVHAGQWPLFVVVTFRELPARATSDGESTTCWCPASIKNKVKEAKIHADVLGSDHCPVSIDVNL